MIILVTSLCGPQEGGPSLRIFPRLEKMFYLLDLRCDNQQLKHSYLFYVRNISVWGASRRQTKASKTEAASK